MMTHSKSISKMIALKYRSNIGPLLLSALLSTAFLSGCQSAEHVGGGLFDQITPEQSGITFSNDLADDPTFNILNYLYYYDGGGVAIGDVNNDGLPDIYFTSNLYENRLYINRGNFRFEDMTGTAGVAGDAGWTKGATMADVNGDGFLDIYVSVVNYLSKTGKNHLFINNGDLTFTERAGAFGLDQEAYGTQAVFFDYDNDGDLDVYQVNHSVHTEGTYGKIYLRDERHPKAGDRLLRNEDGIFVDVSEEAGIIGGVVGYGLAAAVSDLDRDGCMDIYVSNDFHENDYLYMNNCEGAFEETIYDAVGHTSRSSMGNDAADFNNDGWTDIAVVDMLPDREDILKTAVSADNYDVDAIKARAGYHYQYARNTLLLNRGAGRFSDISYLAGVEATDWSWAVLFCDLDNDGYKDIFVTNGIHRRPNDMDYLRFARQPQIHAMLQQEVYTEQHLKLIEQMPQVPAPNYVFKNRGDLTFDNVSREWNLGGPGFSNGAAYADLDNDGDLDLVVNNTFAPASVYKNMTRERTGRHYLTVELEGVGQNTTGIGSRIELWTQGEVQVQELVPTRGWESAVDHRLHFGLADHLRVDSLAVYWPDGSRQSLTEVAADRQLVLRQADAVSTRRRVPPAPEEPLFVEREDVLDTAAKHEENRFFDFTREGLIPHLLSREGPALAVGDVDGDGLDDVFIGGAKWQASSLLLQTASGAFKPSNEPLWMADTLQEHVDAAFFDADGDADLDLYVVSAGNEFWGNSDALSDRLYRNLGDGTFEPFNDALPDVYGNTCCVRPADFDGDGDVDLFVGGRIVPRNYGRSPQSMILENDGSGHFLDVTSDVAPSLLEAGMITDAAWFDVDADGHGDLVLVGEWMSIRILRQEAGQFAQMQDTGLDDTNGLWSSVEVHDVDGDGDQDIVAGNLGRNSLLRGSPDEPVQLYVADFDNNGSNDPIITYFRHGEPRLFASVDELMQSIPELQQAYTTYASFGARSLSDVFAPEQLETATVHSACFFDSIVALNDGAGAFSVRSLPIEVQFAPVRSIVAEDVDGDDLVDLVMIGNTHGVSPRRGRYDAGYGNVLLGDGRGSFEHVSPRESGFWFNGDGRHLRRLRVGDERLLVAARNNDTVQVFSY